jgi:hypothetical protein
MLQIIWNLIFGKKTYTAFLTGSRAYGRNYVRHDSDIDMVVFVTPEMKELLRRESESDNGSIRFSNLNLVATTSVKDYNAWLNGTTVCKKRQPKTRKEAIKNLGPFIQKVDSCY